MVKFVLLNLFQSEFSLINLVCYEQLWVASYFPGGASGEESTCQCRRYKGHVFAPWIRENPLEESMVIHSSILAWTIPWATVHMVTKSPTRLKRLSTQNTVKNLSGCLAYTVNILTLSHSFLDKFSFLKVIAQRL